ncbi:sushi, von Willebrand factor type A, EGF and pentraxin domain-containing protein 1-like [Corticium candelabrum]|uniref:sushi, von Willebrand factor type A, EGF and pentraxin domain-containing protein 1-like n=1 Tax=Corticium candelabrum TaxID=121492 RepID=UPI002E25CCC6|nr:sushi, von Willebrand factor type A, EGF and pentraxin domain-containing protein 1-like [Corticium candelabrum]
MCFYKNEFSKIDGIICSCHTLCTNLNIAIYNFARSCPNPSMSNFMNGTILGDAFFFPETINLTCNEGHELIGGTSIFKCNEKGNWVEVKTPQQETENDIQDRVKRQRKYIQKCTENQMLVPKTNKVVNPRFPTCKPKNCHIPQENPHCKRIGVYFQYPGVVKYNRDYGYCILGSNQIQCNSSGQCDPEHGTVQLSSEQRFVDDTAVYRCHSGYDLNMDKNIQKFTRICLQPDNPHECKGMWSKKPPCSRSCPDPNNSNFRNGSIQGIAYFYPEKIFLNCRRGHELVGGGSYFQCNESGQWHEISKPSDKPSQQTNERINSELEKLKACISPKSNSNKTRHFPPEVGQFPTCQPKNCKRPFVNSNCTLVTRSFHYPNKVMFDRNYGYCVVGSTSSQCNSQGLWSNASPTCERIQCPSLERIRSGSYILNKNNRYVDARARYTCKRGYNIFMDAERSSYNRQCRQNKDMKRCEGYWSGRNPCCIPRSCPNPKPFENGTVIGDHFFYPETISIRCDVGYELTKDGPVYQCEETGSWVPLSGPLPKGHKRDNLRAEAELQLVRTCLTNNSIQTKNVENSELNMARCEPVNCGKPTDPVDGTCSGLYHQFKEVARCTCNPGNCIDHVKITCNANAEWFPSIPTCSRIYCPQLKYNETRMWLTKKRNGQAKDCLKGKFCYGDTVTFDPRPGYSLDRSVQLVCEQNKSNPHQCAGFWHPNDRLPQPLEKSCPPTPVKINNGLVHSSDSTVGSTISFSCSADYELKDGSDTRICLSSGQWSGMQPRCEHVCAKYVAQPGSVQYCNVTSRKAELVCPGITECPSDLTPVCSSDTQTYDNLCLLKIYGCRKYGVNDTTTAVANNNCLFGGICTEPQPKPTPGDQCEQTAYRYFYNTETSECERYANGPCYKGHNSFYTLDDCKDHCETSNPCISKMDPGLCYLHQLRYYYNLTEEKCMEFNYSGCYGNDNNFISESTCEAKCSGVRIPPTPVIMTAEDCCRKNTLKDQCRGGLVLDINATDTTTKNERVIVGVKFKPRNLKYQTVQKYKNALKLSLPIAKSEVEGCDMKCPKFGSNKKYLVVVKGASIKKKQVKAEKYHIMQYKNGEEKSEKVDQLKQCNQILKCPNLQSISNGSVSVSSNYLGGMATYQCKAGFDLIGSHTRSCEERSLGHCSFTWTEHPPTCRAKDCGDPGVISRGRIAVIQGD